MKTVVVNDLTLNYFDAGRGPVVLCIHGWASSLLMWQRTIALLRRTYRVIALDLPGFGDSTCPPAGFDYAPATYASIVDRFVQQVVDPVAPVAVIGHSMGGLIAAQLALDHRHLVGGLILADPAITGNIGAGMGRFLRTRLGQRMIDRTRRSSWLNHAGERGWLTDPRFGRGQAAQRAMRDLARAAPDAVAGSLHAVLTADLSARLGDIDVPTLIIAGAHDVTIPLAEVRRAARQIPTARLAVVPRASHLPMDEQPELFDRLVMSFLQRYMPDSDG